jgi:chromosome segregation ATPase
MAVDKAKLQDLKKDQEALKKQLAELDTYLAKSTPRKKGKRRKPPKRRTEYEEDYEEGSSFYRRRGDVEDLLRRTLDQSRELTEKFDYLLDLLLESTESMEEENTEEIMKTIARSQINVLENLQGLQTLIEAVEFEKRDTSEFEKIQMQQDDHYANVAKELSKLMEGMKAPPYLKEIDNIRVSVTTLEEELNALREKLEEGEGMITEQKVKGIDDKLGGLQKRLDNFSVFMKEITPAVYGAEDVSKRMTDLQKQIESVKAVVARPKEMEEALSKHVEELNSKLEGMQATFEKMERFYESYPIEDIHALAELKKELDGIKGEHANIEAIKNRVDELYAKIDSAHAKEALEGNSVVASTGEQVSEITEEVKKLKQSLAENKYQKHIEELTEGFKQLSAQVKSLESKLVSPGEISKLREKAINLQAGGISEKAFKEEMAKLQQEMRKLESRVGESGKAYEELHGNISGIEDKTKKLEEEVMNFSESSPRMQALTEKIASLEKTVEKVEKSKALPENEAVASIRRELGEIEKRVDELGKVPDNSYIAKLEEEVEALKGHVDDMDKRSEAKGGIEPKDVLDRFDSLEKKIDSGQVKVAELTKELGGFTNQLNELRAGIGEGKDYKVYADRIEELDKNVRGVSSKINSEYRQSIRSLQDEIASLKENALLSARMKKELTEHENQLTAIQEQLGKNQINISKVFDDIQKTRDRIGRWASQNRQYNQQMEEVDKIIRELDSRTKREDVNRIRRDLDSVTEKLSKVGDVSKLEELRGEINKDKVRMTTLAKGLNQATQELSRLKSELKATKKEESGEYQKYEESLSKLQEDIDNLSGKLNEEYRQNLAKLQRQVNSIEVKGIPREVTEQLVKHERALKGLQEALMKEEVDVSKLFENIQRTQGKLRQWSSQNKDQVEQLAKIEQIIEEFDEKAQASLGNDIKALQLRVEGLASELGELKKESVEGLSKQLGEMGKRIEQGEVRVSNISQQLSKVMRQVNELQTAVEEEKKRRQESFLDESNRLTVLQTNIREIGEGLVQERDRVQREKEVNMGELRKQISSIKGSITITRGEMRELQRELTKEMQVEVEEHEKMLQELEGELDREKMETAESFVKLFDKLESNRILERLDEAQKGLEEVRTKLEKRAKNEEKAYVEQAEELAALQRNVTEINSRLEHEYSQNIAKLENRIRRIKEDGELTNKLKNDLDRHEKTLAEIRDEIDRERMDNAESFVKVFDKIESFQGDLHELVESKQKDAEAIEKLEAILKDFDKRIETKAFNQEVLQLATKVQSLTEELRDVQQVEKEEIPELEGKNEKLATLAAALQERVKTGETGLSELSKELNTSNQHLLELRNRLKYEVGRGNENYAKYTDEFTKIYDKMEKLSHSIGTEYKRSFDRLRHEVDNLKGSAQMTEELESKVGVFSKQLDLMEERLAEEHATVEEITEKAGVAQKQIEQWIETNKDSVQRVRRLEEVVRNFDVRIKAKSFSEDVRELKEKLDGLSKSMSKEGGVAGGEVSPEIQTAIAALLNDFTALQKQVNRGETKLNELSEKMEKSLAKVGEIEGEEGAPHEKELEELKEDFKQLSRKVDKEYSAVLEELEGEIAKVKESVPDEVKKELEGYENKLKNLRGELSKQRKSIDEVHSEVNTTQEGLRDWALQNEIIGKEIENIEGAIAVLEESTRATPWREDIRKIKSDLSNLVDILEGLGKEERSLAYAQRKMEDFDKRVERILALSADKKITRDELKLELQKLDEDLNQIHSGLEQEKESYSELHAHLNNMEKQLQRNSKARSERRRMMRLKGSNFPWRICTREWRT